MPRSQRNALEGLVVGDGPCGLVEKELTGVTQSLLSTPVLVQKGVRRTVSFKTLYTGSLSLSLCLSLCLSLFTRALVRFWVLALPDGVSSFSLAWGPTQNNSCCGSKGENVPLRQVINYKVVEAQCGFTTNSGAER